ncbi:DNA-processing protein DprA [Candidatus Peregrinibacteria bacterium]|nr:DNA-processing protein DprA [Candidatus Peregrinibacteria bacterium]
MNDEYLFLFAQWGIFTTEQCRLILSKFGSFKTAWKQLTAEDIRQLNVRHEKSSRVLEIRERISFEQMMTLVRDLDIKIHYVDDEDYPMTLKNVESPPPFLFVRGKLPEFHKAIAVVGTRGNTDYGKNVTKRFTSDLVRHGFVIVSGLAIGIDSIAHRTALELNGTTVAVLGSGIDVITPFSNHRLAQEIIQSEGAILSAYPLGTPARKHHFPERNAIISGLCQGVLVTEGGCHSGALHTVKAAHEQGREVFAVPIDVNKYALSGTNRCIREGTAKLVENVEHILEEFKMKIKNMTQPIEFTHEERIVMEKLATGEKSMDDLVYATEFDVPKLSEIILHLQLKNAVVQQEYGYVIA